MPTTATTIYSASKLQPLYRPEDAHEIVVKLSNGTYAKGTILAELASTPGTFQAYVFALLAAGVAAVPSEGAAGALGAGDYTVSYTYVVGTTESAGSIPATATLGASKRLNIASVAIPSGVDSLNWYISDAANSKVLRYISNQVTAGAQVLNALPDMGAKMVPTTGTARAVSGTAKAKAILPYACVVTAGAITGIQEWADPTNIPVYVSGWFSCADLTGLDAYAVSDFGGHLINGTLASGCLHF